MQVTIVKTVRLSYLHSSLVFNFWKLEIWNVEFKGTRIQFWQYICCLRFKLFMSFIWACLCILSLMWWSVVWQDVLTWLHNVSDFPEVIVHFLCSFFTSRLTCLSFMTAFWGNPGSQHLSILVYRAHGQATPEGQAAAQVLSPAGVEWTFLLAHAQMSLSSLSQAFSGFLLNYWATVSSLIISFSQTCCGLIFLNREAPKTQKRPEGTGKEYSLFAHMNCLEWAGRRGVGRR